MKKILSIIAIAAACCASCIDGYVYDDAHYAEHVSLGATEKEIICEPTEGTCVFNVLTNCDYEASIISGENWTSFADTDLLSTKRTVNDKVLTFDYKANNAGNRVAKIVLAAGNRRDTIAIKQKGLYDEHVEVSTTTVAAPVEGGTFSVRTEIYGLLEKDLKISTIHTDIVTNILMDDNKVLSFDVLPNKTQNPRTAEIIISFVNGWGETEKTVITVNQTWH